MSDKHVCSLCGAEKTYNSDTRKFEFPCGHEELVNNLWSEAVRQGGNKWENRDNVDHIFNQLLQAKRVEHATAPLLSRIAELEEYLKSIYFTASNAAGDGDLTTSDLEGYLQHIAGKANEALSKGDGDG